MFELKKSVQWSDHEGWQYKVESNHISYHRTKEGADAYKSSLLAADLEHFDVQIAAEKQRLEAHRISVTTYPQYAELAEGLQDAETYFKEILAERELRAINREEFAVGTHGAGRESHTVYCIEVMHVLD